jgi:hypothetical protein
MSIGLLVAERDQRQNRFVCLLLLGRGRMRGAGCFPCRSHADLVLQFENNSLSRLLAEPADFGDRCDVRGHHCRFETGYAHPAQHGQRQLWPDAGNVVDKQSEKIALGWSHESIQHVRILAHGQMREDANRLPDRRQLVIARQRNEYFVANSAYIDCCLGGQRAYQFAIEKGDHVFVKAWKRYIGNAFFVILSKAKDLRLFLGAYLSQADSLRCFTSLKMTGEEESFNVLTLQRITQVSTRA